MARTVAKPINGSRVVQHLHRRYGVATPTTTLRTLLRRNPQWDRFDWSLFVVSLEIDLRVDIPQRLADAHHLTIAAFSKKIATLPKVERPDHTLEMLTLLAHAILTADEAEFVDSSRTATARRGKPKTAGRSSA